MQEKWVWSLIQLDPTCHKAIKPMCHNYWACALEPRNHNHWAHIQQLLKPTHPRAHALRREKPLQWGAHAPQQRVAQLTTTRESPHASTKTLVQPKKKQKKRVKSYLAWPRGHNTCGCLPLSNFFNMLTLDPHYWPPASLVPSVPCASHKVFAHPAHSCWIILPSLPFQYQLMCPFPRSRLSVISVITYCPIRGSPSTVLLLWRTRLYLPV